MHFLDSSTTLSTVISCIHFLSKGQSNGQEGAHSTLLSNGIDACSHD